MPIYRPKHVRLPQLSSDEKMNDPFCFTEMPMEHTAHRVGMNESVSCDVGWSSATDVVRLFDSGLAELVDALHEETLMWLP